LDAEANQEIHGDAWTAILVSMPSEELVAAHGDHIRGRELLAKLTAGWAEVSVFDSFTLKDLLDDEMVRRIRGGEIEPFLAVDTDRVQAALTEAVNGKVAAPTPAGGRSAFRH
jgi:hypothetical protein